MTALWQDVRYAIRMLRKSPGFTAIAVITLAVGIGANTVMFSLSDLLLLLQPRKVKNPEQLAFCGIQDARFPWFRYSEYLMLRDSGLAFSDLLAQDVIPDSVTLVRGDAARQVQATYVSANYFSLLGVAPAQGRFFLPEEERLGGAPAVVLSRRCWQRLGSDPRLVGAFVTVHGVRGPGGSSGVPAGREGGGHFAPVALWERPACADRRIPAGGGPERLGPASRPPGGEGRSNGGAAV